MKAKFEIIEDTVTGYLNALQSQMEKDSEYILNHVADEVTGKDEDDSAPIPKLMSTRFNPYLYISGQLPENREVKVDNGKSVIEILYSGMGLEEWYGDEAMVWWEFSKEQDPSIPPRERTLARDYAYYQETGADIIADYRNAKHKRAIQTGLTTSSDKIAKETARQYELMLGRVK